MPSRQEIARRDKVRRYRVLLSKEALATADAARERASRVLETVGEIFSDSAFKHTLKTQGVTNIPRLFALADRVAAPGDPTLHFAAAWAFMFPLLTNDVVVAHLQRVWPGFIVALKDAFIALVLGGPFPRPHSVFELNQLIGTAAEAMKAADAGSGSSSSHKARRTPPKRSAETGRLTAKI